jgi:hypothetical protein
MLGMGWYFSGDASSFSYNPQTANVWGSFTTGKFMDFVCLFVLFHLHSLTHRLD